MRVDIRPLTLDLAPAYLDFFDNRAFSDGNPNGPCYCNASIMDAESLRRMIGEFGDDCKGVLRRYAARQLAEEKIRGYLAFDGGAPVGWCNAGDMDAYPVNDFQFIPDFARQSARGKTLSIVCFAIAPGYHGKGVATALLSRAVADAAARGYAAAEGYPHASNGRMEHAFKGPIPLYEKVGFFEAARIGDRVVMRKTL